MENKNHSYQTLFVYTSIVVNLFENKNHLYWTLFVQTTTLVKIAKNITRNWFWEFLLHVLTHRQRLTEAFNIFPKVYMVSVWFTHCKKIVKVIRNLFCLSPEGLWWEDQWGDGGTPQCCVHWGRQRKFHGPGGCYDCRYLWQRDQHCVHVLRPPHHQKEASGGTQEQYH